MVKSGERSARRSVPRPSSRFGTSRSTSAPPGTRPLVVVPSRTDCAWPAAATPPTTTDPWATAYTSPSAPIRGVTISVPPCNDRASPRELTCASIGEPWRANGGRVAVTTTAAVLRVCKRWSFTFTPMRSSIAFKDCWVNGALRSVSPLPCNPITRP